MADEIVGAATRSQAANLLKLAKLSGVAAEASGIVPVRCRFSPGGGRSMTTAGVGSSRRIADLLEAAANRQPEAFALIATAERIPISYRDLVRLVDNVARQLTQGGLRPGDRAALRAYSSAQFTIGLLAASRAKLVVVPLDPALPIAEQHARVVAAGARIVLVDDDATDKSRETAATREPALPCWPILVTLSSDADADADADAIANVDTTAAAPAASATPDGLHPDDALIMFTGGTTGSPKMVPWTNENIASSVHDVITTYGLGPHDATVAVMPLFHGHGLIAALLSSLASGGTVLLPARGRFSAHTFADDIHAARATWFTAVPTIHQILLERAAVDQPRDGHPQLRFIRSCSAALSPETAQALRTEFAAPVLSAYGMTESTHQLTSTRENQCELTSGLVGRSTGAQIQIVGGDGRPCPPDAVGEIWVRGRTVVRGYLDDAAATARTFTNGWLHTGDLGSLSATGELTLRGRIKELIIRGGENISPERVEGVLAGHPNVVEAAVFGVPDPLYGETVAAVIVPNQSATPTTAELAEFCRERLATFEVPATITVTSELPHTAKGSVDRRAVAQRFGKAG
jgi:acyl-CoA synthetase (AMP-forming)/AMP-acid ligase II